MRLLSLRARTGFEIESRLQEKGYSSEIIGQIVAFLKKDGLIDDLNFSKEWIEYRLNENPRGVALLRAELSKKGVSENIVEKALQAKKDDLDEKSIAVALIKNKLKRQKEIPELKLKARLYQFLVRKGFDSETAEEAIEEVRF